MDSNNGIRAIETIWSQLATGPHGLGGADDKQLARLNIIKDILSRLDYADKAERLVLPDLQIVSTYDAIYPEKNLLAR